MHTQGHSTPLRIAVVGGGIAGIAAAYALQHRHRVVLFDQNAYLGGHTHTIVIADGPDAGTPVDTGFIVFNDRTYPLLNRFFRELGVAIEKSDMSFSYYEEDSEFQYASSNPDTLFAQRRNLLDPSYWSMLGEILRFNRRVTGLLESKQLDKLTIGKFLRQYRFSPRFRRRYLFPMVAAIWSAPELVVDRFPMLTFARFFHNHGLLTVMRHPQWYVVSGGSHTYVKRFVAQFPGRVVADCPIVSIRRGDQGVSLRRADGKTLSVDRVVIATHADQALSLLTDPSDTERRLLGAWRYSTNETYLHRDVGWMPSRPKAWASWNFVRQRSAEARSPVTLTYYMNRLQRLSTRYPYLVTLNPFKPIAPDKVVAHLTYTHPVFDARSLATQALLPALNGVRSTYFCGSYFGYGFHEDAARSGFQAAASLGGSHAV